MMPSLLGRLRIGRGPAPASTVSTRSPQDDCTKANGVAVRSSSSHQRKPTPGPVSSNRRLRSWFSLKRSRKERVEDEPPGRPPTPTPYSLLPSSNPAKTARPRVLRRVRPPAIDTVDTSKEDTENQEEKENKEEGEEEVDNVDENGMTEEERIRLAYFANGVKGLMDQLKIADKESRRTPPITNAEGTPLSPISEADEPEHEHEVEPESQHEGILQPVARAPSITSVVTDLDYGELLDPADLAFPMRADPEQEEEDLVPRWNPDVAEMIQSEMGKRHQEKTNSCELPTPITAVPDDDDDADEGRVDDGTIEHEIAQDEDAVAEDKAQTDTETESESVYFSAASIQDEGNEVDMAPIPSIGLRLCGVELASPSSSESFSSDSSDDNERTVDGDTVTPKTPRLSPRSHLPSQLHPMFRPETIDGTTGPELKRTRAFTLPAGRDRVLPPLPRLSIPRNEGVPSSAGSQDPEKLMHTVFRLQREKARLERELELANNKIERQDRHIAFLDEQIVKLHSLLVRAIQGESGYVARNDDSSVNSLSIIDHRAPEPSEAQAATSPSADAGPGPGPEPGPSTLAVSASALSTPPATPDRRAVVGLLMKDGNAVEETRCEDDLDGTPKAARGLVRRNSAGAASALSELGLGRAQMKRRAGSEDLKRLTASPPCS